MSRFHALPKTPARPHTYFELPRRRVEVSVGGTRFGLSYVEHGEGPPLLLVHGLMTSAYTFRYVIPELARAHRVIAVDLPGAGASDAPADLRFDPETIADVLEAFLGALGIGRAYVIGNSLGGYLVLWLALRHPERIERLVVMHAPGFPELRLHALKWLMRLPGVLGLLRLVTRDPEAFVIKNVHYRDPALMSQEEAREYGAIFRDPARLGCFARVLGQALDPAPMGRVPTEIARRRAEGRLPRTLLLWSTEDTLVSPRLGERYHRLMPEAPLEWIEDTSHFMHVDTPERIVPRLLAFGRE